MLWHRELWRQLDLHDVILTAFLLSTDLEQLAPLFDVLNASQNCKHGTKYESSRLMNLDVPERGCRHMLENDVFCLRCTRSIRKLTTCQFVSASFFEKALNRTHPVPCRFQRFTHDSGVCRQGRFIKSYKQDILMAALSMRNQPFLRSCPFI